MRQTFKFVALAILLIQFNVLGDPAGKVTVSGLASEKCNAIFRQILPQITEGDVEAYTGTLSQLRQIMRLAGATSLDQELGSNSIFHIMRSRPGLKLLAQVSKDLMGAMDDENALSICVLHGNCKIGHSSAATHVSTGHAYGIKPLFGGARSEIPAAIDGNTSDALPQLWQGLVLKFQPTNGGDTGQMMSNVKNFYHEAAHFSDTLLLNKWAKAIQAGAPVHPKLKKMISPDGKTIDEGFIRLFMEARAEIVELESLLAFSLLSGVPAAKVNQAAQEAMPQVAPLAIEGIDKYGTIVEGAKRELGVDASTVLQRAYEIEEWMRFSL